MWDPTLDSHAVLALCFLFHYILSHGFLLQFYMRTWFFSLKKIFFNSMTMIFAFVCHWVVHGCCIRVAALLEYIDLAVNFK